MSLRIASLRDRAARSFAAAALILGAAGCASTPRFQGMAAADLYALGQREYEEEEYEDAIEALDRLLLSFPDFPQAAEARFLLAEAYFADEQYLVAVDEFVRFLDRHRGHAKGPEAALGACRAQAALSPISQRDQTYTLTAVSVCRNVVSDYPGQEVAQEAAGIVNDLRGKLAKKEYDNGEQYFRLGAYFSAIIYWEMVVDLYADTEWAPAALLGIVRSYEKVGYDDMVEEYTQQLLTSYPDSDAAREVRGGEGGG